jgi:AraC-like DNA-binding protein
MKNYSIQLSRIDSGDDFKHLAHETAGWLDDNDTAIHFNGALGRGHIKKWHLEAGLYLRIWDLLPAKPIDLHKTALPVHVANKGYSLLCILTPESTHLQYINQHRQFNKVREKSFVLMPDTVNACISAGAHLPVQLIDFAISSFWLKQQPGYAAISRYLNNGLLDDGAMPAMVQACRAKHCHTAAQLFASFGHCANNDPGLVTAAVSLIGDFLQGISREEAGKTPAQVNLYYEKIKEAETILITHLQKTLPRLDNIAQKLALSESTLKRYFKLIYGKSIYEYYLNRKMEMARTLLLQQPLTVNEAAEIMGYEKVSNFIDIFKKHHGYSPGSMKRKAAE